jgi:hypothetical protein
MVVAIYHTATEYTANAITMARGTPADIVSVGVYHNTDPQKVPDVADFTEVRLVLPGDLLAEGSTVDILSLIGPGGDVELQPGDYQRWTLITTVAENIIDSVDTVSIL